MKLIYDKNFKEEGQMEMNKSEIRQRNSNTIKFCYSILAIICGVFFTSMIFYQFIWKYFFMIIFGIAFGDYYYLYQPHIYYPEIFITGGITLLLLGHLLLLILRRQVKEEYEKKKLEKISIYLCFLITIFFVIFIPGLIISYYYLGTYNFFNPVIGVILMVTVIFTFGLILRYMSKLDTTKNNGLKGVLLPHISPILFKNNVLNYRVITAFLFAVIFFSPLPLFSGPTYSYSVYWENEELPYEVVLPGMNAFYNLTMEITEGQGTSRYIIVEMEDETIGNWSVNPREVIVKSNEEKTITFINYVPLNATDKTGYAYCFALVEMDDAGLCSSMSGIYIRTYVTEDKEYFNASKSIRYNALPMINGTSSYGTNFYFFFLLILSIITLITWVWITVLFRRNKKQVKIDRLPRFKPTENLNHP